MKPIIIFYRLFPYILGIMIVLHNTKVFVDIGWIDSPLPRLVVNWASIMSIILYGGQTIASLWGFKKSIAVCWCHIFLTIALCFSAIVASLYSLEYIPKVINESGELEMVKTYGIIGICSVLFFLIITPIWLIIVKIRKRYIRFRGGKL